MSNYWCNDSLIVDLQLKSQSKFDSAISCLSNSIPKIIHFIWLGSGLPVHCKSIIQRCKDLHPAWEIKVWTDDDVHLLQCFHNKGPFLSASNFGMKSDILRYEILYEYGGVYADVDYEWLQSLDSICSKCTFFAGIANTSAVEVNNGFIGSVANHPLLLQIINSVKENCKQAEKSALEAKNAQLMNSLLASFLTADESKNLTQAQAGAGFNDTIKLTGPGMLTKVLAEYLAVTPIWNDSGDDNYYYDRIVIFDKEVFSAIPNTVNVSLSDETEVGVASREAIKQEYVTDRSVAVHWWQKSWYKS